MNRSLLHRRKACRLRSRPCPRFNYPNRAIPGAHRSLCTHYGSVFQAGVVLIAREIHQLLTDPPPVPHGTHLRQLRQSAHITIADAAQAINTHTNRLSELERGTRHNHDLAVRYHR